MSTDPTINPEYLKLVQRILVDAALRSQIDPLQAPENFFAAARALGQGIAKIAAAFHPDDAHGHKFLELVQAVIREEYTQAHASLNAHIAAAEKAKTKPPSQEGGAAPLNAHFVICPNFFGTRH